MESIKKSIAEMTELFNTRMAEFQGQVDKSASSTPTVSSLAADFRAFKDFMLMSLKSLQLQVEILGQQVDSQEMRSRRKILLFHGVPEAGGEDTSAQVVDLLKKFLKSDLTVSAIARSHRMGRPRSNQTRCVLVKFRDVSDRDATWFGKTGLKGSGVIISEFLTKPRHDVFMAARERFGVRSCYTRDGSVYVLGRDGERCCVTSCADFDAIQAAPPAGAAAATRGGGVSEPPAIQPGKRSKRETTTKSRT